MALWHYATLCTAAQAPQSLLMQEATTTFTTAEIKRSRSFSVVVGFLWLLPVPPPVNHPPTNHNQGNRTFTLIFGGSGLPLAPVTTNTYYFPHNC